MKPHYLAPDGDLGYLLNKATRRLRLSLAEGLAGTGLTTQQAAVLFAVARSEEQRLTPRGIAESIDTDQATTTGLLERLTRDEWIASEPNPGDRRSRLISLTAKAKEALPLVAATAHAVTAEATACLSATEVLVLSDMLSRLCAGDAAAGNRIAGSR